jgi:hypothetical protein
MDLITSGTLDDLYEKWQLLYSHQKQQRLITKKILSDLNTVELLLYFTASKQSLPIPPKMENLVKRINRKLLKKFNPVDTVNSLPK